MTQNGSICAEEYVVKRGDSFYLIAHKLGVPLRDLLAANRDIHPARLMVGDVLCIPREEDDRPQGGGSGSGNAGGSAGNNSGAGAGNGGTVNGSGSSSAGNSSNTTGSNTSNAGDISNTGSTNTNQQGSGALSNGSTGTSSGTSSAENTGNANNAGNAGSSGSNAVGSGNATSGSPSADGAATNGSPIATPPPVIPVPGLACPIEEQVTIAQGQTIADIQLQNLLSRNTLQTANPALDLDTLEAGQTICVPTENIACRLPSTYTLAAGETLEAVAMRFNLPLGSLLRVNPCLAPQDFEEGVTVILPR